MNWHIIAADAIVILHLAYVLFVLVGLALIYIGWFCRWKWVRNFWFRLLHLVMIAAVVFEVCFDFECPLTTWENQLRAAGGDPLHGGDFVARCVNAILFPEYTDENRIYFTIGFYTVGALIFLAMVLVPPRWPWAKKPGPQTPAQGKRWLP
jgi:hypothetical protein